MALGYSPYKIKTSILSDIYKKYIYTHYVFSS